MFDKYIYMRMIKFYIPLLFGIGILSLFYFRKRNNVEGFVDLILPKSNVCAPLENCPTKIDYSNLYTSDIPRSLYFKEGRLQDTDYSSQKNPKKYNPPCLTKKPYGNSMALYRYWKQLPDLLAKQYSSCDKYMCGNKYENGYTALPKLERCIKTDAGKVEQMQTLACDVVNQDYYNSPEEFCRTHPEDYPCPNWWRKNPEQVRDVTISPRNLSFPKYSKVKPQVPYTENNKGFCLSTNPKCNFKDGPGILMVMRGREDRALC